MKKSLLLMCLFVSIATYSQTYELGKVTVAELEQKVHPLDSSAAAAYIFKIGEVKVLDGNYSLEHRKTIKVKIKIYNKDGYDWANSEVPFYDGSDPDIVTFSDMATYNLVNGQIVKTVLTKDEILTEKKGRNSKIKHILLKDVKEGSIVEYQYIKKTFSEFQIDPWFFQSTIPVDHTEFKTIIPDNYTYNINQRGYVNTKQTVLKQGSLTTRRYVAEHVPALKEEAFVYNINNYVSSVFYEIAALDLPGYRGKNFATDWETLTKTIVTAEGFEDELKKTGYFDKDIDALLAGIVAPEKRMELVFQFVSDKIKWNKEMGLWCDKGVRAAYKEHTGNIAEINLMLVSMLRYAGLDANPVLLSTRSNGISLFPSISALDCVVAAVKWNGKQVFMDASEKFSQPGILPLRDLNWFGRIVYTDGKSENVSTVPEKYSIENTSLILAVNDQKQLEGKVRIQKEDFDAMEFRKEYEDKANEMYLETVEDDYKIQISDYIRENSNQAVLPLIEKYSFVDTHHIESIGDAIYINPLVFLKMESNPFKMEKREYPVDFGYPSETRVKISIKIPEGYEVNFIPENTAMVMEGDLGSFKYVASKLERTIQISMTQKINTTIVSFDVYDVLKGFYEKMLQKQNEKIILKKIE